MQFSVLFTLGAASVFLSTATIAQRAGSPAAIGKALSGTVAMSMTAVPALPPAPAGQMPAATKEFRGTVVDEVGEPLAGAVVSVVAGKNQFSVTTTTNAEGEYVISSSHASPMLLVTYAGYTDVQQTATSAHPITFQLEAISNYDRQLKKQAKSADKGRRK